MSEELRTLAAAIANVRGTAEEDASHFRAAAAWESLTAWLRLSGLAPVDARALYGFVRAIELALRQDLLNKGIAPSQLARLDDMAYELSEAVLRDSITDAESAEDVAIQGGARLREDMAARKGEGGGPVSAPGVRAVEALARRQRRKDEAEVRCDKCGKVTDGEGSQVVPGLGGKPLGLLCRACVTEAKGAGA